MATFAYKFAHHPWVLKLRKFDAFAFRPIPRYDKGKESSAVGLLLTVVMAGVMIFYIQQTSRRFIENNPSISLYTLPVQSGMPVTLPQFGVIFRSPLTTAFWNRSFLRVEASTQTVFKQVRHILLR
jgi:hypothetical protein